LALQATPSSASLIPHFTPVRFVRRSGLPLPHPI